MNTRDWHPGSEEMLRAIFGEGRPEETERIEKHLAACPACARETGDLRRLSAAFQAAYAEFRSSMPPPPRNWAGFQAALRAQEHEQVSSRAWLGAWLPARPILLRTAAVAALGLLLVVSVQRIRDVPRVSAKEILERAEAAQSDAWSRAGNAAVCQKLQVRIGPKVMTRTVYRAVARKRVVDVWEDKGAPFRPTPGSPAIAAELARDFREMRLDWTDPLSASGIRSWVAERMRHSDSSESVREAAGSYTLVSLAPREAVSEAQFVIRASDYHPVGARFHQRSHDDVELTELAYEIRQFDALDSSVRAGLLGTHPDETAAPNTAALALSAAEPDPEQIEMDARYLLHRHQADLGEETRVERAGRTITIRGLVATQERRDVLRSALGGLPGVRLELQTAEEAAALQARALGGVGTQHTPVRGTPLLEQELLRRFPEQQTRDAFVLGIIEACQSALAHGFALRDLAARYPRTEEAALPAEARGHLQAMRDEHSRILRASVEQVFEQLAPLVGAVRAPNGPPGGAPEAWQHAQSEILPRLQTMDRLLTALLSGAGSGQQDATPAVQQYQVLAAEIAVALRKLPAGLP